MTANNYIILDAARLGHKVEEALSLYPNHESLYKGRIEEDLAAVGPYLFTVQKSSDFSKWFFEGFWGDACGIMISSQHQFEKICQHFRKFLLVKTENGRELYFRFYDPRVLRTFLPTCDIEQVIEFFGPVDSFITESENKENAIIFKHKGGELIMEEVTAEMAFGELAKNKLAEKNEAELMQGSKKPPRKFIY